MVEEFDSETFAACLKQAVHQWQPAIAQLEFTWMAQYANACRPAKTILVEHDITFDLQEQLLDAGPDTGTARMELSQQLEKWRAFEIAAWSHVDCVVTMSARDNRESAAPVAWNVWRTVSIVSDFSHKALNLSRGDCFSSDRSRIFRIFWRWNFF